jgi:MFS transporter, DHA2 family, methylenomycin A resistance protein
MCAGYFLVLLDVTIVNVALPSIGSGLGADVSDLQWVVDGYAIALASLMLVGGAVGDLHGHKRIVLVGLGVFGVASLACGAAPSAGLLVGARVLQGWVPPCCCRARSRSSATPSPSRASRPRRSGSGPASGAWPCPPARCSAGHSPTPSAANAAAGAMNLGTLGMLFVLTLYLQTVQHRSALAGGVAMLPLFLPLTVLAPLAGRLTARVGPKLPMAAGLLTAAVGVGLLVRAQAGSGYRTLLPALLLWGIGLGVLTPAVVAAAVRAVPARRRARLGRQQHRPSGRRGDRDRRLRGHRRQRRPGQDLRRRPAHRRAHRRRPLARRDRGHPRPRPGGQAGPSLALGGEG